MNNTHMDGDDTDEKSVFDQLAELLKTGLSTAEAFDYYACEVRDFGNEEWAEQRGCSRQAVNKNVKAAEQSLPFNYQMDAVVVTDEDIDVLQDLLELVSLGLSTAEAFDYFACEERGYSKMDWGDVRGISRVAVHQNFNKAEDKLSESS